MRIGFFSSMAGLPWGGSEELWSRAAQVLLERGHEVTFNCVKWPTPAARLQQLIEAGATPHFRSRLRMGKSLRRALEKLNLVRFKFLEWLRQTKPEFVLISFSCHTEDPQIANTCRMLGIRYAIVLQAAGPGNWVPLSSLADFQSAYAHAERCYFVSAENRQLLEANLAIDLSHSEVVDNPFNVSLAASPSWPSMASGWKLACAARIHFVSKSQDLLVRVLSMPKWRARPLTVTMFGADDGSLPQLQALIDLHGLRDKLKYAGFADDIEAMWSQHHGLLLPSRMEGNSLSLIEAMMCGRVPITTNVGRAAELIDDNVSGFIAPAATGELIDEVLERAWQRRNDWQVMGERSARIIRQRHSLQPGEDFADRLLAAAAPAKSASRLAA
ncbi:MAG TPA: glycosyltransferase family 4 protein [Lacipirellulaceae bacterium]|jgi:glycosyltransferase involved in cell wall biosynthesis